MSEPTEGGLAAFVDPSSTRTDLYGNLPRIELRQLRYFLAVAEELNFTRAAEKMGIAQPPLSQQILVLEQQLRVKLLNRSRRHVSLTPEGEAFILYARRIINNTQIAAELVGAIKRGEEGPLSVAAIFSSIYTVVPQLFEAFVAQHPRVRFHLQEMTIGQQLVALREERIDLGILRGPIIHPEIETHTLLEEPFVVVVSKKHPLAKQTILTADQVLSQPLIRVIPSVNRDYSHQMFSVLANRNTTPNIVHEVSDTHTLLGLVAAGMGISMVPASVRSIHTDQLRYIPLREGTPTSTIQLAWLKDSDSTSLPRLVDVAKGLLFQTDRDLQVEGCA
ncbi:LysR family transcriptional regulator [Sagittula stellata]|uniref:Regulatory protein, LysR:LysR, substrate-binding n=1 Tax=Sagittula stellata (strain ATCC 700073 / DSM 11524 / E-37) TaxID=388399 RepID=A3K7Z5_SAGS3|nr:LysR substrate-binding domain-containing protein [Sagittula stellata]EBA06767.1 regulatory protein, LysR:LysR, substrate-binding [Sagittula stellata E-37]